MRNAISARTTKMLVGLAALAILLGAVGATLYARGHGGGQGQSAHSGIVTPLASAKLVFDGEPECLKVARENGDPDIGASTFLLEAGPGCVVPAHLHTAEDQLMVVRGDVLTGMDDMSGKILAPGGFAMMPGKVMHWFTCK